MIRRLLFSITAPLLFFTVVSGQVTFDINKDYDLSTYKTYKFNGWDESTSEMLNDLEKGRIEAAFKNEFDTRGILMDGNHPDMYVTLFLVVNDKKSVTAYTNYHGNMGMGWRYGGRGWGMGSATTNYVEDEYRQGTLVIDCYDAESKELMFQGVLRKAIHDKPSKREKGIPKAVKKLMKKYPVKPM